MLQTARKLAPEPAPLAPRAQPSRYLRLFQAEQVRRARLEPAPAAHPTPTRSSEAVYVTGFRVDSVTETEVINRILSDLALGRGGWVVTLNVDILRLLHREPELRTLSDDMTLVVPDGMPLLWASRLQGTPLAARVTGSSLIASLSAAAALNGAKVFLLGGSPPVAAKAAEALKAKAPALQICGICSPPPGFDRDPEAMNSVRKDLIAARPDLVYVCLGSPKGEYVIRDLRHALPAAWFLGLGGALDMVAGEIRRAPRWIQQVGMEWFWRLIHEPRRLSRRYLIDDFPFAARLLIDAMYRRRQAAAPLRSECN